MHNPGNLAETAAVRPVLLELLGAVDALAETFVRHLEEGVVPYSDGAVAHADLVEDAVATYERVLRRLADLPIPVRLVELSRDVGRRRAGMDIPLAALTTGTRLHFRVVWEELVDRLSPQQLASAVTLPVQLWQAVEEHSADVQVGYHDAAAALAFERDLDRRRVVQAFLDSDGEDEELLGRTAAAIGARRTDVVLAAVVPGFGRPALREAVRAAGGRLIVHDWHAVAVVLVLARAGSEGPALPSVLSDVPCAQSGVAAGLSRLPHVVKVAAAVAAALPPTTTGPRRLGEELLPIAAGHLAPLREEITQEILGRLLELPAPDRERLLEVLDSYVATGSITATAAALYCHRNTVLNRLRRIQSLTGCDATVPARAAILLLALAVSGVRDG